MQAFKTRVFLRFHMSLILIGTALVGLLASKLLLMSNVTSMSIRYPLAIIISYLAFFGFVKLWLSYIMRSQSSSSSIDSLDLVDPGMYVPDGSSTPIISPGSGSFSGGGGGKGGGGGASESFDIAAAKSSSPGPVRIFPHSTIPAESVGETAGDAASGILEEGGWVLIVLGILLAIVFGAGLFMIYDAPFILSEAAFEFILSVGLIKSVKKIDREEWTGSIFRRTWIPFAVVLVISLIAALFIQQQFPEAQKLFDIFRGQ